MPMTSRFFATAAVAVLLALPACSYFEEGRLIAAQAAATAVRIECGFSDAERSKNLNAVNAWLNADGLDHRAVALDCDGDGTPDL